MRTTTLGRTGLSVSVAGLGAGGFSRLGLGTGSSEQQAEEVVKTAIDEGVNFIDTAAAYGTEHIVGRAIRSVNRSDVVISTKALISASGELLSSQDVCKSLEESLKRLQLDHVDVFHLHAVRPEHYDHVVEQLVPALMREREKGKFAHLGITETSPNDHHHRMLRRCLNDANPFEVVMLAFHMMHQSARVDVFPRTQDTATGTLIMFAVRSIFANPPKLMREVSELVRSGALSAASVNIEDPLGFLVHADGADSVIDAAYRYCAHEPGADVVLFGTGKAEHVRNNVASINAAPLPGADTAKIQELFASLVGVGLELPPKRNK